MQNGSGQACAQPETPKVSLSQHNLLVTPEIPSPLPKFSWETPWSNGASVTPEKYVWSQPSTSSQNVGNFHVKPMVASAPVTPNVVPYHDSQYPYVYNYHVDNYNSYNSWSNSTDYNAQKNPYPLETEDSKEKVEFQEAPNQYGENYEPQTGLTIPPPNPQVEVYSPVIPIPPGTPVIYAHPSEMPEMMVPTAPFQVYTPPVDMQYVSPAPYFYSPTIPTTWYPLGINSQGFIFPTPVNQNLQSN
jgi:hypothetical protein